MIAKIYSPAKTAMQSGKGKTGNWVLVYEPAEPRKIDPLMGYTTSSDMNSQIRLAFGSLEDAKAYADKNGIAYLVEKPKKPKRRAMAYSDNFKHDRALPWTH